MHALVIVLLNLHKENNVHIYVGMPCLCLKRNSTD